jgi:hypothetical protein
MTNIAGRAVSEVHTAARLLALRDGETFIAYRGNLEKDIAGNRSGAPRYAAMLDAIAKTLRDLELAERIAVQETKISKRVPWKDGKEQRVTVTKIRVSGISREG